MHTTAHRPIIVAVGPAQQVTAAPTSLKYCRTFPRIGAPALRPALGITRSTCTPRSLSSSNCSSSSSSYSRLLGSSRVLAAHRHASSQPNSRQLVVAAARRKTEQPTDPDSAEALPKLPVAELRARCEQLNLSSAGKKAELVDRLVEHLSQQSGSAAAAGNAEAGDSEAGDAEASAEDADAAAAGPTDAAAGGPDSDISFDDLVIELEDEFKPCSKAQLVQFLQDRGLPATGNKPELVQRLAVAVAEESFAAEDSAAEEGAAGPANVQQQVQQNIVNAAVAAADEYEEDEDDFDLDDEPAAPRDGMAWGAAQQQQQPDQQQQPEQQQQQPEQQAPAAASSGGSEREWLVADKQQAMLDELLAMGVKREELMEILAEMGQAATQEESLEELAERASWLLAEEEVLLMEQQAGSAGVGADALAASPSSILDTLTATDINKMKVDDLRSYLRQLGLSDEGGRYVLRDRLMTMLVVRRAATAGDMDNLLLQLSQMTLSELRSELERRGLDLSGTKAALEMRLAQALVVEIVGPEAAGAVGSAVGLPAEEEEGDIIENPLLEEYDEVLTAAVDPAVTVALICGTAPATTTSSSSSSPAARLRKVAEALATANTLIDELHTAPLDEQQAAAMAAAAAAAAGDAGSSSSSKGRGRSKTSQAGSEAAGDQQSSEQTSSSDPAVPAVPACGICVDIYWADEPGVFYQLPRTALAGLAPADLAAQLPALASARFADAAALAKHLASSSAAAALSVLPGGALALSGRLSEACAAAGVPLAGPPAFEGASVQLSGKRSPVIGRSAVLQELKGLGYMTLPVLEFSRQDIEAATGELQAWLGDLEAAAASALADENGEGAGASEEDPDAEEDAVEIKIGLGDSSSSSSSNTILKEWNNRPEEAEDQEEEEEEEAEELQQPPVPALVQRVLDWAEAEGIDPELQVFTLGAAEGGEPLATARGAVGLVAQLLDTFNTDSSLSGVLVEPLYRKLVRWEVVVVASPEDGPVALLPAELEQYSAHAELADADLALQEWQMMQAGMDIEDISAALDALASTEPPVVDVLQLPSLPDPLPHHTLKMHMPPRASTKITQTIRHTAAKAVAQLGLEGAGLVRVGGWMALKPDWQEGYVLPPEAIQKMPDFDAGQLARMRTDQLERRAQEPLPLADYYDEHLHMADLGSFDPATRCRAEGNGEGDVLLSRVEVDVPLHANSMAGLQALEVGLSPGGLARHLINLALMRANPGSELLPPPAGPVTCSSAQWAQSSGANDSLQDIMLEMAQQAIEAKEENDNAAERAAVRQARRAFASLPFEAAVSDVLAGLTSGWMTEEELAAPPEEPEEWEPQFDGRTQEEVHAERDAGRPEEDLAARALRDEGLDFYGKQPIHYDRFDPGDDWVPPAILAAQAAAEGKPVPSIRELQQQLAQQQEQRKQELLARTYSPEDSLPPVTEDEVLVGRILGHDRYKGGVLATLKRRVEQQGDAAGGPSAAAGSSAGGGLGSAAGSGPEGSAAGGGPDNWPWPDEGRVVDEAAERRAAPRVWVLVGGDGLGRQQAFRSGVNVAAKLQRCCDLQVDVFLLPPAGAGLDETQRRAALLARRTEWRALGIPEEMHPPSMSDAALIEMPPTPLPAHHRQVMVGSPQALARHSLEEAAEAAERAAARARMAYHAAHVTEKQQLDSQYESQMEVDAHYVQGVGVLWGADAPVRLPPPPRFMDLEEFIDEAADADATLLLALDDSITASGTLQQLLEGAGVGYTGMTADFAFKCSNRLALSKAIDEIAESLAAHAGYTQEEAAAAADDGSAPPVGLLAVPKKIIKTAELLSYLDRPKEIDSVFGALLHEWESTSVCIKPPTHSGGTGVVRISTPEDLATVAEAIRCGTPRIPAGTLSQQPLPVTLPLYTPDLLVVEPWIETDPVVVSAGAGGAVEVEWAGSSRWVEVTVGLLGELGSMSALQPTLIARAADGSRHQLTPPPQHIMPAAAVEAVQGFAVALADGLGLRSIAAVDGFVNVDSGELIVLDVKSLPSLTDGSPILHQAMLHDPPMLPYQLFRHLARQAYQTNLAALEAAAAGVTSMSSAYYSAPAEAGGAGFGAQDFDLGGGEEGGLESDLFVGAGGFGGVEEAGVDEGAVEDEDVQGMAAGWTRQ